MTTYKQGTFSIAKAETAYELYLRGSLKVDAMRGDMVESQLVQSISDEDLLRSIEYYTFVDILIDNDDISFIHFILIEERDARCI